MQRKYADPPPQFADIGRWCGFFMSLRGVALDIIVETHSLIDTNTAVALGKALEPYHIMYLE